MQNTKPAKLSFVFMWFMMPFVLGGQQPSTSAKNAQDELVAQQTQQSRFAPDRPNIVCEHGMLSISADRATLFSVLAGVRSCAGIQMDIPTTLPGDLSYIRLGPGPEREILEDLLATLPYNFVIQAFPGAGDRRLKVSLMDRTTEIAGPERVPSNDPLLARPTAASARAAFLLSHEGHPNDTMTLAEESVKEGNDPSGAKDQAAVLGVPSAAESRGNIADDTSGVPTIGAVKMEAISDAPDQAGTPAVLPIPTVPAIEDPAVRDRENRIKAMQQMFEQRKQLGTTAPSSPPQ